MFVGNHPYLREALPALAACRSPYEGREQVDRLYIASSRRSSRWSQRSPPPTRTRSSCWCPASRRRIGWIADNVPAIVHIANSGQELGNAVADVLFGDYNPGGRTTMTWYASETDIPTDDHRLRHQEGDDVLVLHRHAALPVRLRARRTRPSSTRTRSWSAPTLPACGSVDTSGSTSPTTSAVDGDEVVQLYVSYPGSAVQRPLQQLRGFRRVNIAAGATVHVTLPLRAEDLAYWSENAGRFLVEDSKSVEVQIGASSRDIRFRIPLAVTR